MEKKIFEKNHLDIEALALGKKTTYHSTYNPSLLYPIPRYIKRLEIGVDENALPFFGFDCWNHYEVSWLNTKGKPIVGIAEILYDCTSPMIIESKSLKLYFNSLNLSLFDSKETVQSLLTKDLSAAIGSDVQVNLMTLIEAQAQLEIRSLNGECLDDRDILCTEYLVNPRYLKTHSHYVKETLCSHLLKSNCLVTHQPDWGSVQISYEGKAIDKDGLLQYIVSFRNHDEFHEQCIERIFVDIMQYCQPDSLTVYGRYTRRGGIDINPYRSTEKIAYHQKNHRLIRQ
jgi:7-cyano-7-deazaguanine reductase